MIYSRCPSCYASSRAPEALLGRRTTCPRCGTSYTVEEVDDLPPGAPPLPGGRGRERDRDEPAPERTAVRERAPAARGGCLGAFTLLTAGLALLVALAALALTVYYGPLGGGARRYNFSTPKDAMMSRLKIEANRDVWAMMDLSALEDEPRLKEKMKTIDVRQEEDWKDYKVLFISYEEKGVKKYTIMTFKKEPTRGYWLPTGPGGPDIEGPDRDFAARAPAVGGKGRVGAQGAGGRRRKGELGLEGQGLGEKVSRAWDRARRDWPRPLEAAARPGYDRNDPSPATGPGPCTVSPAASG